ncbi:MAG: carbon monoxide dehydrogenase subunit G [Actinobacteria bacterium]|nr:carbon monoxide dehydrogenase subunit G [Actinomycetota bacterium]
MKVSGEAVLHAPVETVWAALNDPEVLRRTIPGCERLDETGPDVYAMTVSAGVGSIKGSYAGKVALSEQQLPSSFLLSASGAGAPGTVRTEVRVKLDPTGDGGTRLIYDADAEVGGMVAGVGQRMLTAVAKKMAAQFFDAVDRDLRGERPVDKGKPTGTLALGGQPGADRNSGSGPASAIAASGGGSSDFLRGTIVGAAIALAGVLTGALAGRMLGRRLLEPRRS